MRDLRTFKLSLHAGPRRAARPGAVRARLSVPPVRAVPDRHPSVRRQQRPARPTALFLLGTDQLGRDVFSRLVLATRISLTIGLVGVALSLVLGVLLGGISGLYGGWIDTVIQRVIEILRSIPTIPLWMGLAAALPTSWCAGAGLLRHHHHHLADRLDRAGARRARPVPGAARGGFRHRGRAGRRLAACASSSGTWCRRSCSHIIAATSLALPAMIISETSLSLPRPRPAPAGDLLGRAAAGRAEPADARPGAVAAVAAVPVIIVILAFNFLGDGLRDAADPYG